MILNMGRHYFLDNLKLFLMMNVIMCHTSLPFIPWKQWIFRVSDPSEVISSMWVYAMFVLSFVMSLFFFISGYFMPSSYSNSTFLLFIKKKFLRLGIPLLFAITVYELLFGTFHIGHMWFAESLLIFSLIYAIIKKTDLGSCIQIESFSFVNLCVVGMIMAILTFLVGYKFRFEQVYFLFKYVRIEPTHYFHYVVMFILGIVAYRNNLITKITNKFGCFVMIVGLLLLSIMAIYGSGLDSWESIAYSRWYGIYESFLCVFLCVGFLWFFREYCNYSNRFLKWCCSLSYGCYIFHFPILYGIELLFDNLSFPTVFLKFLFEGFLCVITTVSIVALLKKIPGVNKVI